MRAVAYAIGFARRQGTRLVIVYARTPGGGIGAIRAANVLPVSGDTGTGQNRHDHHDDNQFNEREAPV